MSMLHSDGTHEALAAGADIEDPILAQLEARAIEDGFPTVGREVGQFLRWIATISGAKRVFECGSGFGYSAYWLATALPPDGEIVLTEVDADELDEARHFLESAEIQPHVRFEHADALDVLRSSSGPFDLILLDHENERYREGFEAATDRINEGGTIVADNVLHSTEFEPGDIAAGLADRRYAADNSSLAGILAYYRHVQAAHDFSSILLPLGEGIMVSNEVS